MVDYVTINVFASKLGCNHMLTSIMRFFGIPAHTRIYASTLSQEIDHAWSMFMSKNASAGLKKTSFNFLVETLCISKHQPDLIIRNKLDFLMALKKHHSDINYIPSVRELPDDTNVFVLHQMVKVEHHCLLLLNQIVIKRFGNNVNDYFFSRHRELYEVTVLEVMEQRREELLEEWNQINAVHEPRYSHACC